jgi:hypothetical protein
MAEFIQNPRRSPRAPVRCRAHVVSGQGSFEAATEDVGGHGCQVVSPRLVRKGEPIQLMLAHEVMSEPLRVSGRVAWASERAPWRLGIAYAEDVLTTSQAWFDALLARLPDLAVFRRIPDRIPLDAVVYLGAPPKFLADFTPDEVAVLRSLGSGTSVAELRALLRDRWQESLRALFSLLAHNRVTLTRGASVHPDAWKKALAEAESSLAVEALRLSAAPTLTPRPAPPAPAAAARPAPARPGTATPPPARPMAPFPPAAPPPAPVAAPPSWPAAPTPAGRDDRPDWLVSAAEFVPPSAWPAAAPAPAAPAQAPQRAAAGEAPWAEPAPLTGGFALPPPSRSREAQGCYERALTELEAGRVAGAAALLRRALALSPGDAELAAALAQVSERTRR